MSKVFVYCFTKRGRIIYVGTTVNLMQRENAHRKTKCELVGSKLHILIGTNDRTARAMEEFLIRGLIAIGQCELNRTVSSLRGCHRGIPCRVDGKRYISELAAARAHGFSTTKALRKNKKVSR